jgi:hypothetical protein
VPSNPPRKDTTKKREQLSKREQELKHAIRVGYTGQRLVRAVENFRSAQLSLLKAKLYWAKDNRIRGRDTDDQIATLGAEMEQLMRKKVEEILAGIERK